MSKRRTGLEATPMWRFTGRQIVMSEACQTKELTTWDLLNRIELPLDWTDQARRLGCG